jgi:hypothetical protein
VTLKKQENLLTLTLFYYEVNQFYLIYYETRSDTPRGNIHRIIVMLLWIGGMSSIFSFTSLKKDKENILIIGHFQLKLYPKEL